MNKIVVRIPFTFKTMFSNKRESQKKYNKHLFENLLMQSCPSTYCNFINAGKIINLVLCDQQSALDNYAHT